MPHRETSSYGETALRMLRVLRHGERDDPREVTVGLRLEGAVNPSVPGEAIKNLVHRVARGQHHPTVEALALALGTGVLEHYDSIARVRVDVAEQVWSRIDAGGKAQGQVFRPAGAERRTAIVTNDRRVLALRAGLEQFSVLRTAGFAGTRGHGPRDSGRADGVQPLFIAALDAEWTYAGIEDVPFALYREGLRAAIVETLAWADAGTPHALLRAIADVALSTYADIDGLRLLLRERPYRPVDLLELAMDGDALFVARDEPVGMIEVHVSRSDGLSR